MDLKSFFKGKVILVAGGTGTIGSEILTQLIKFDPKTIRILSNSENELWECQIKFKSNSSKLRFLLGDIRDYNRVKRAMTDVDYVFNAAAIKHVPISEYNPMEAIDVNITGLDNLIRAAVESKVKKFVHISTDKAVNPTTVMGATKMLGERLCISREYSKGLSDIVISCVRFGNVLGSRGSIIPLIKNQIRKGNIVTLTSGEMKRFFMSISQAVGLVLKSMVVAKGGEIYVLKMPTVRIKDLIDVLIEEFSPKVGKNPNEIIIDIIGPRPGEKLDEDLISPIEYSNCISLEDMFVVRSSIDGLNHISSENINENLAKSQFCSTSNAKCLSKLEIRDILIDLNLI